MTKIAKILIVDDELNIRNGLKKSFELDHFEVETAEDAVIGLKILDVEDIDLVITDLKMPHLSGEEFFRKIKAKYPDMPVIILTGHGTIDNAVDLMRQGAYNYLTKPIKLDELTLIVKRALDFKLLEREKLALEKQLDHKYGLDQLIGNSTPMKMVYDIISQVAPSQANVLITGESGTGKELAAMAIHRLSPRKAKPIIKVNCAALNENLLESELFGHEKGAFTGALSRKKGRFELADGGTLFLDEIGEISPLIQVKLLRVLQEREFERVGGEQTIKVDVRIIAATNKTLEEEIKEGNFREDLYYRLKVISIHMPPLRERKEDLNLLIQKFIKEFAELNNKSEMSLNDEALRLLQAYDWPGNIRELRNIIEGAVVLSKSSTIIAESLPMHIRNSSHNGQIKFESGITLREAEKKVIITTLLMTKGNITRAAEILDIGRKTIHRKIDEYGINVDEIKQETRG